MRRLLVFAALSGMLAGCGTKGPLTLPPGPPGPPLFGNPSPPPKPAKKSESDDSNKPAATTPEERK